jgi:hypothetical protein
MPAYSPPFSRPPMKPSQAARRSASASSASSSPKLLPLSGTTAQAFFRTASRCQVGKCRIHTANKPESRQQQQPTHAPVACYRPTLPQKSTTATRERKGTAVATVRSTSHVRHVRQTCTTACTATTSGTGLTSSSEALYTLAKR